MKRIPWRLKSAVFGIIDRCGLPKVLYFLQKYVTRRSSRRLKAVPEAWQRHQHTLSTLGVPGTAFEFGAGKNLGQNLFLSPLLPKQIVVDLNPMADIEQIQAAAEQLSTLSGLALHPMASFAALEQHYGISYRAPFDATRTGFADKSIGVCLSTNTLEHIPLASLRALFQELHRILMDDGYISAKIDYSDHYAHTDATIGLLNFLQFSDAEWQKYNHACHYQNRLRHYDFEKLFADSGFKIIVNETTFSEDRLPPRIDPAVDQSQPSWRATSGYFLARKSG